MTLFIAALLCRAKRVLAFGFFCCLFQPLNLSASPILHTRMYLDGIDDASDLASLAMAIDQLPAASVDLSTSIEDAQVPDVDVLPGAAPNPAPLPRRAESRGGQAADEVHHEKALSPNALRNVLRSIVTVRRRDSAVAAPPVADQREIKPASRSDYGETARFDLLDLILDSDLTGAAARALIDVKSNDGELKKFAVLGLGDCVLEMNTSTQSAIIYELSSGWSATLVSGQNGTGLLGYSAGLAREGRYSAGVREHINLVRLAWEWIIGALTSPFGVLAVMMVVILTFVWLVAKSIALLQRRASASRTR